MAGERTVYIKVGAKVDGAIAGLRKVQSSVNDLTKADLKRPQKAFDDLSNKGALIGGVVALGIGKAISSFADFDQAMSGVAANSGATGQQLDALRQKAIQLGSDTQFSATEAAQGINELAKAGVSSQEILNGGLKGALDLAAAGQIGVAQAAETTASALNQFEQDGSQATHVADLLSNAANAAQGGVGDMGQALGQAGVAAHAAGLDIDETTTLLALFAKAGLIGSDAGTSLKTMMQRLSAPTDQAAGAMEDLGISAYDAQGNFVGAESLVRQLSESTKDLSTEAKMSAFNIIFGSDAIRAASIASSAGADGYKKMATEVTKAGGAAENAAKLTDNLKGDIERLGGSIETAFISGGSSANDALRTLTQGLGGVVDVVAGLPAPLTLAATGLAAIAFALPKGLSIYRQFASDLDTMGLSLDKISAKAPKTAKALELLKGAGLVAGIAAVSVSIQEVMAASEVATVSVDKLAESLNGLSRPGQLSGGIADLFRNEGGLLVSREEFVSTADAIERFNATAFDALSDGNLAKLVRAAQPGAEAKFDKYVLQIDSALAQLVQSGHADQAKASLDALINGIDDPQVRDAARAAFTQYDTAVKNFGDSANGAKTEVGRLNDVVGTTAGSASSADGALQDMADNGLKSVELNAKDAKAEMQNLLNLVDSMAGGKRALAADKAALKDAGDAAIKAAKDRGGNDPDAVKAVAEAKTGVTEAQGELKKARSGGKKEDITRATKALTRAQDSLASANKRLADSYVAPEDAQAKYEEAMRNTAATGDRLIHDLIDQKKPISEINAAYDEQRKKLIKAAEARGYHGDAAKAEADKVGITVQQMDDLRFQYANTQEFVDTQVRTPGLAKAKTDMEGYWTVINGIPTFVPTTVQATVKGLDELRAADAVLRSLASFRVALDTRGAANRAKIEKATGGAIYGPGTGTSDSIPAMLSNGEHVLTAAEVKAAGGHAAIYALRKAIMTGGVQYRASGGPVGHAAYRPAPPAPLRLDLAALAQQRGGDTITMNAYGLNVDDALKRNVRDLFWERDHRR
ncbi:phage tail tape measure protein [Terrabacter sp. C0L_2]|uniref:phage tail tape measure protein n=1 Tax=Terrabacter sp. C0L_2 TaxID=3108389 RepID=UPI002ED32F91|nr:phage tail tape measure protein [Terrabacter sp. C0L_2]